MGIRDADAVAAVLIAYWVALALGFSGSGDRRTVFALLLISAVLATIVKVSSGLLLVLTLAIGWFHRTERPSPPARLCATAGAVLAVWMLHGMLLSGCAVYPVRQTCFSGLSWAASQQEVDDYRVAIQAWARKPWEYDFARVLQDWSWFPQWFDRVRRERFVRLLMAGVVLGALAALFAGARIRKQPRDDLVLIAAGLAVCLSFWFWSAPDPRFGSGFIVAAGVFGFSLAGRRGSINHVFFPTLLTRWQY